MAWTSPPRTWTTNELVTAAMMNTHVRDQLTFLESIDAAGNTDTRTFTNTGFLDLDALTGGSGTVAAISLTVTTGTRALVTISGRVTTTAGAVLVAYRVSGATTIAAGDHLGGNATAVAYYASYVDYLDVLTAGSNTFELQARVTAGTGTIDDMNLIVQPLPG